MVYSVEISDKALLEAGEYIFFLQDSGANTLSAAQWWNGLMDAFLSLEHMPERCPIIREPITFGGPFRSLVYLDHRIFFRVKKPERVVQVLRVYHGARQPFRG